MVGRAGRVNKTVGPVLQAGVSAARREAPAEPARTARMSGSRQAGILPPHRLLPRWAQVQHPAKEGAAEDHERRRLRRGFASVPIRLTSGR